MVIEGFFPMFTTTKFAETKQFYARLGFEIAFEADWYIQLIWPERPELQIGFMKPDHPSQPPLFQSLFGGQGLFFGIEVPDVEVVYAALKSKGHAIAVDLRDEAWGQRHFAVQDPNGIALDFITRIEPTDEFAELYAKADADHA